MLEFTHAEAIKAWSHTQRDAGRRVGLVPTMGYLHAGHMHLIDMLEGSVDAIAVSVFVNPLQFGPNEDFDRYPRDADRDRRMLAAHHVDCVFRPSNAEMYSEQATVTIDPGAIATHLCGRSRPGHFRGVLTVVAKLLHIVEPDVAIFGRKDYQQATLIKAMARDLDFPVTIATAPIVREHDGLAMSSRNEYLDLRQRNEAASLARALDAAHARFSEGERGIGALIAAAHAVLADIPSLEIEYLEIVDPHRLDEVPVAQADSIMAVAAVVGRTRLIDNAPLATGTTRDPRIGHG